MNLRKYLLYNLWYYQKPPWDTGVSPPELLEFIREKLAGRALDLGCGTGTNAITLAKHGWQTTGVDFAWRAVRLARRKAKQAGVVQIDFHMKDVTRLQGMRGPFDLILDIGCYHSLSPQDRGAYSANLQRLLAPGGTFLLYAFLKERVEDLAGISREDTAAFSSWLEPVYRREGSDRAGGGRSAWLRYSRPLA